MERIGTSGIVLLLGLFLAGAAAQRGESSIPAPDKQQQMNSLEQLIEVTAFPLAQLPGCNLTTGESDLLPEGLMGNCEIQLAMVPNDPQIFVFSIPENAEMSAVFTLHVVGGEASMSIWYPGTSVENPPNLIQNELYSSPASSEGWISIPPETLAMLPGQYLMSITAFSGSPDVTLAVRTPGKQLQLVTAERDLMRQVVDQCCTGNEDPNKSPFCGVIAPESFAADHPWITDLCHLAPSSCNAEGHLTELALPGLGISCLAFPKELGQLQYLRRLDLTGNNFGTATMQDVAQVVSNLTSLEELALGNTGLDGSLTCELPNTLKVLDVAYNKLDGSIPLCLLNTLVELFVPGNALSGTLPAPAAGAPLRTLYANLQHGEGLTGSIPVSIGSLRNLQFFDLGGNGLSGALPGLPNSIKMFNISGNAVSGHLGSLPTGLWQLDVSSNDLSGPLPSLANMTQLEVLSTSSNVRMAGTLPALPGKLKHLEAVDSGLVGTLPTLPRSLRRIDVSDNALTGSVEDIDMSNMEVFRAANNGLTGSVPASAASSPLLFLLDLHGNGISGSLTASWTGHRLQMIMLEQNAITGTIPSSLASLPNLGVLRLGNNKLVGQLTAFAAALPDAAAAAVAAPSIVLSDNGTSSKPPVSRLFDFNVTANQLTGPVPEQLADLGVFNPSIAIIVPGNDGQAALAPRSLDLSGNQLAGEWPGWLLDAVPSTLSACGCLVTVQLSGPGMRLACPSPGTTLSVTDYMWQVAAEQRYTCRKDFYAREEQLLDYLTSPSNNIANADTTSTARGDGGGLIGAPDAKKKGAIAGAVIGVVLLGVIIGVVGYFVVYKRIMQPAKLSAFHKFQDDAVAAIAADAPDAAGAAAPGVGAAASAAARPM